MKLKKQNYATNSRNDKITQITLELKKVIKKIKGDISNKYKTVSKYLQIITATKNIKSFTMKTKN